MGTATQVKPAVRDIWLKHSFQQTSSEILVSNAAIPWVVTQEFYMHLLAHRKITYSTLESKTKCCKDG